MNCKRYKIKITNFLHSKFYKNQKLHSDYCQSYLSHFIMASDSASDSDSSYSSQSFSAKTMAGVKF